MLSPDPVKRNINPYPYCDNDPVNYNDPTGEIANILVGAGRGGFFGGAAGFIGNAASQLMDGRKINWRRAAFVAGMNKYALPNRKNIGKFKLFMPGGNHNGM